MIALLSQPLVKSEIDSYVSHPGNIPDFHNFSTPQLEPGENMLINAINIPISVNAIVIIIRGISILLSIDGEDSLLILAG